MWSWFIDGHLLPYSRKEKVHHSYYTQRRIPYPGQTNLVSTDSSGKIAHFDIQEGLGDLKGHILELSQELQPEFGESPIMVFDRESYGNVFFHNLISNHCTFVCWEKNIDQTSLKAQILGNKIANLTLHKLIQVENKNCNTIIFIARIVGNEIEKKINQ